MHHAKSINTFVSGPGPVFGVMLAAVARSHSPVQQVVAQFEQCARAFERVFATARIEPPVTTQLLPDLDAKAGAVLASGGGRF